MRHARHLCTPCILTETYTQRSSKMRRPVLQLKHKSKLTRKPVRRRLRKRKPCARVARFLRQQRPQLRYPPPPPPRPLASPVRIILRHGCRFVWRAAASRTQQRSRATPVRLLDFLNQRVGLTCRNLQRCAKWQSSLRARTLRWTSKQ